MDLGCTQQRGAENLLDVGAGGFRACYVTYVTSRHGGLRLFAQAREAVHDAEDVHEKRLLSDRIHGDPAMFPHGRGPPGRGHPHLQLRPRRSWRDRLTPATTPA